MGTAYQFSILFDAHSQHHWLGTSHLRIYRVQKCNSTGLNDGWLPSSVMLPKQDMMRLPCRLRVPHIVLLDHIDAPRSRSTSCQH